MQNIDTKKLGLVPASELQPKRKAFRRPIDEILDDLAKPIPPRLIKSKSIKGQKIEFVPWYTLNKLMDFYAPGWEWFCQTANDPNNVCVVGQLILIAEEGRFSRSACGDEHNDVDSFGSPWTRAEQQSFRRCCARWGLGLAFWEK